MPKYDDASWHNGASNFPSHLPPEAGATHIGFFVAWVFTAGLAGKLHTEDFPDDVQKLLSRSMTPGAFFYEFCDGKFTDEDLNETGNLFAASYYDHKRGSYFKDYAGLFIEASDIYAVPDTWQNFDRIRPLLDQRFRDWQAGHG